MFKAHTCNVRDVLFKAGRVQHMALAIGSEASTCASRPSLVSRMSTFSLVLACRLARGIIVCLHAGPWQHGSAESGVSRMSTFSVVLACRLGRGSIVQPNMNDLICDCLQAGHRHRGPTRVR